MDREHAKDIKKRVKKQNGAGSLNLLRKRRFAPFFWTQFMGAFNDNVFKNSLMLMIAFQGGKRLAMSSDVIINLAAGLFIVPFFLFSATAGQIADKMEKSLLIRRIKLLEVAIMVCAGLAFWLDSVGFLLGLLFLMGTQSAFFGPVKYSIMPEHLNAEEILGGNALVEMGTFIAILLGTLGVAIYIYSLVPEFSMRFLVWMITHTMYRFRHRDLNLIPESGPAVLVCNHVSYMDALLIIGACRRPVRFVIFEPIYRIFMLHFIFKAARAIPIASHRHNPVGLKHAFEEIANALEAGEVVCIFPEGQLTRDGQVGVFKSGIERIIKRNPVPVVPLALKGLWGSFFSHKNGHAMYHLPRRFWSRVELVASRPVNPAHVTAAGLQKTVAALRGDAC